RGVAGARIGVGRLDGGTAVEGVVLCEGTERYRHGALGEKVEAASVTVIDVAANALAIRFRYVVKPPAVIEDLIPVLAPIGEGTRAALVMVKSAARQGSAVAVLGGRAGGLATLAD